MKKTIGALALLVSGTAAHALIGPGTQPQVKEACVAVWKEQGGNQQWAGSCDETPNNQNPRLSRVLLANGCTKDQAKFSSVTVKLPVCPDPRIVQL